MLHLRFHRALSLERRVTRRGPRAADALRQGPVALVLLLMLSVAACSTPERVTRTPPPEPPDAPRGPVTSTVDGYRVQIGMVNDQAEADDYVEAAIGWYRSLPPSDRPPYLGGAELDVDIEWRAPYYRVQIGSFANRSEAERALGAIARRFPEAFLVPAVVTVTR